MQHLEVSGAVRYIYIYIYVVRQLRVNVCWENNRHLTNYMKHVNKTCGQISKIKNPQKEIVHKVHKLL